MGKKIINKKNKYIDNDGYDISKEEYDKAYLDLLDKFGKGENKNIVLTEEEKKILTPEMLVKIKKELFNRIFDEAMAEDIPDKKLNDEVIRINEEEKAKITPEQWAEHQTQLMKDIENDKNRVALDLLTEKYQKLKMEYEEGRFVIQDLSNSLRTMLDYTNTLNKKIDEMQKEIDINNEQNNIIFNKEKRDLSKKYNIETRLKELIKKSGLTQEQVANKIGITSRTMSNIVSSGNTSTEVILKLSELFGTSANDIFKLVDEDGFI